MELKDKSAIVTGGGRGIGEGIAKVLAREGARVAVADINVGDAERVVAGIEAAGGEAVAIRADVSTRADCAAMVEETVRAFGTVDILVNNAGIELTPALLEDLPEEQWDRVLAVNLKGAYLCCQAAVPTMIACGSGRIVNIASIAGLRMTFFGSVEYTASKHGMIGLTQHLAWELADHRITVNAVCPGGVLTPLMEQGTTPEYRDAMTKRVVPLGRFCTIEDIGEAVSFLASGRAAMITGQFLAVDGGVLQGYGEDLRAVMRKRIREMQEAKAGAGHA